RNAPEPVRSASANQAGVCFIDSCPADDQGSQHSGDVSPAGTTSSDFRIPEMAPRSKYLVGVDLGGTNIVAGALAEDGSDVIALRSEPTRADQGAEAVVDRIVRMIDT